MNFNYVSYLIPLCLEAKGIFQNVTFGTNRVIFTTKKNVILRVYKNVKYNSRLKDVKYAGYLGFMAAPPIVALKDSEFYQNLFYCPGYFRVTEKYSLVFKSSNRVIAGKFHCTGSSTLRELLTER